MHGSAAPLQPAPAQPRSPAASRELRVPTFVLLLAALAFVYLAHTEAQFIAHRHDALGGYWNLGVGACTLALAATLGLTRLTLRPGHPPSRGLRAIQVGLACGWWIVALAWAFFLGGNFLIRGETLHLHEGGWIVALVTCAGSAAAAWWGWRAWRPRHTNEVNPSAGPPT